MRRAVLSLHDVTPAFETEIRQALGLVRGWGVRAALLVVPDFHGRWSLESHPAFCEFLGETGAEILLHGFDHLAPRGVRPEGVVERLKARLLTSGEGEFQILAFGRAVERIERGLDLVERCAGVRPVGFVAPAWLEHRDTERALYAAGVSFHEDHVWVRDIEGGEKVLAPAIGFTSRNLARTYASVAWAEVMGRVVGRAGDLRLALHPADVTSGPLVAAIGRLVEAMGEGREWVGYRELLERQ